ncbi:MAG: NADH-quinone oxidoreductase subunit, partial [Mucilaginibacter sp.]|nr:NADH-quinone oxidoreductase subunit [Mucilaginibacter sp.]
MNTSLQHTDQTIISYTIAAVALPLLAALINFCLPMKSKLAGWVSTLAILVGCVLSAIVFAKVWNQQPLHTQKLWFTIGDTKVFAG